jgi:hypothetical protein
LPHFSGPEAAPTGALAWGLAGLAASALPRAKLAIRGRARRNIFIDGIFVF